MMISSRQPCGQLGNSLCRHKRGVTLIELLVAVSIVGILASLTLVAVANAREAARRVACKNNMREIGLAFHLYHDALARLPSGTELESRNSGRAKPWRGFTAALLPYAEQASLHQLASQAFTDDRSPFSEPHKQLLATPISLFSCPADGRMTEAQQSVQHGRWVAGTSYLGVSGINGYDQLGGLFGGSRVRFGDVTDGLSNTLLVGERPPSAGFDFGWWYAGVGLGRGELEHHLGIAQIAPNPYGQCEYGPYFPGSGRVDDECSANRFWSLHSGGLVILRLDGSVEFLSYHADQQVLRSLSTIKGN